MPQYHDYHQGFTWSEHWELVWCIHTPYTAATYWEYCEWSGSVKTKSTFNTDNIYALKNTVFTKGLRNVFQQLPLFIISRQDKLSWEELYTWHFLYWKSFYLLLKISQKITWEGTEACGILTKWYDVQRNNTQAYKWKGHKVLHECRYFK